MDTFYVDNGPHIKSKYNTSKMMTHLIVALLPIIIFSSYKNGFLPYIKGYATLYEAFRPIILILIGILTSLISEYLYSYFILRKHDFKSLKEHVRYSYAIFPGLFLALFIPLNTPYSVLALGSVIATIIGKLLFGGFGFNVFNPALVGNLFIVSAYYTNIMARGGYYNPMEIDTVTHATPLTNLQSLNYIATYDKVVSVFGNLWDFFIGFIPGSLGETSALLCLIALIYLLITKVISWRIPVIYIATVFILTGFIGYYNNLGIWYPLFHILSGSLMFGAIFVATDPVTSPTTPFGQGIYALGLGFLTVVFRFLTSYPEGVLTAILTLNMFIFIIDRIGAVVRFNIKKTIIPLLVLFLVIGSTTFYIATTINKDKKIEDNTFKVISTVINNNNIIYTVTHQAYHGIIKAEVTIDSNTNQVIKVNILEQNENVWTEIENNQYIDKIINNQKNLDGLDTISGATYTSNYLKQLVNKTINYYNQNR